MPALAQDPYAAFSSPVQQAASPAVPAADPYASFSSPVQSAQTQQPPADAGPLIGRLPIVGGGAGLAEGGLHVLGNMVGAPAAGLAGLGAAATNALGITNTPAADIVNKVSDFFNYQPRTPAGKAIAGVTDYPFQKLAQGADAVGTAANQPVAATGSAPVSYLPGSGGWPQYGADASPATATVVNAGVQALPSLLLKGPKAKVGAEVAAEAPKPAPIEPRQALIDELAAKGIKVTPTQAGAPVGSVVEGLVGPAKLERSISMKNAPRVNEIVGEDVGLKGAKTITQGDLNRLKIEANKPYKEIANTGTRVTSDAYRQDIANIGDRTGGDSFKGDVPRDIRNLKKFYGKITQFSADDAVNKIRQLRSEASKNIKAVNAPEQNAKGQVQRAIADALDNELARHVESLGKPELAANYKAARVQLAKIYTLEDALKGSNVSAAELAKAKDRGAPLSGNMDLVARAHQEFDRAFQDVGKIRNSNPFSVVDLGAGVVGAAHSLPLAAAVVARPLARAALASDRYQRGLASGSKAPTAAAEPPYYLARPAAAASSAPSAQRRAR